MITRLVFFLVLLLAHWPASAASGKQKQKKKKNYLEFLPDQLVYFAPLSSSSDEDSWDEDYESYMEEWRIISKNNTRRVFNFGIGSLTSYASRQRTVDPSMSGPEIAPAFPDSVHGIVRELATCYHLSLIHI